MTKGGKASIYYDLKRIIQKIEYFFWIICKKSDKKHAEIAVKRGDFFVAIFFLKRCIKKLPNDAYLKLLQELCVFEISKKINYIKAARQEELLDKARFALRHKRLDEALYFFAKLCLMNPIPSAKFFLIGGDIFLEFIRGGIEKSNHESVKILIEVLCNQSPVTLIGTNNYPVICTVVTNNILEKNYQKIISYLQDLFEKTDIIKHKSPTTSCFAIAFNFVDKNSKENLMEEFFEEFSLYALWPMILILQQYLGEKENVEIFRNLLQKNSQKILNNIEEKSAKQVFELLTISKSVSNDFYQKLFAKLQKTEFNDAPFSLDLNYILGKKNLYRECSNLLEYSAAKPKTARKPKIAVCISGQLRGYKKAFDSWKNFGADEYDVTYFVHTWRSVGRASLDGDRADRSLSGKFLQEWKNAWFVLGATQMQERYKSFFKICDANSFVAKEDLEKFYGTKNVVVEDDSDEHFTNFSNAQKMYYKVYECHKMMRNFGDFDLVIRIRPDKELQMPERINWSDIYQTLQKKSLLMVDMEPVVSSSQYKNFFIGDQVAIGLTEILDVYSATYKITSNINKIGFAGFPAEYISHANFGLTCVYHNIEVEEINAFKCGNLLSVDFISAQKIAEAIKKDIPNPRDNIDAALLNAAIHDYK